MIQTIRFAFKSLNGVEPTSTAASHRRLSVRRRHLASAPIASPTHISCVSLRSRTAERIGKANFACAWAEASSCRHMVRTPRTYGVLPRENGLDILANRKRIVRSTCGIRQDTNVVANHTVTAGCTVWWSHPGRCDSGSLCYSHHSQAWRRPW